MSKTERTKIETIRDRIYTIRGVQVMLDEELTKLYGVETRTLNQAVKRNLQRFPERFMFQLTETEFETLKAQASTSMSDSLRSQNVILETSGRGKYRKYLPYAFTEQGVSMLSAVLRSETAVKVSIQIMDAFVSMRRFLSANAQLFQRLDTLELKQAKTDQKVERVLNAIESGNVVPKQGIFFDGQVFDAYAFVCDLIRAATQRIILIDNYVDESVLTLLSKRKRGVSVQLLTKTITRQLAQDIEKFNKQYPPLEAKEFKLAHDRFLIIDNDIYHIGASLKDLGKKWFAFSKFEIGASQMVSTQRT